LFSPRWLFLLPGIALSLLGFVGYALAMPRVTLHGVVFDVHTLLFASLAILTGYQAVLFAVFTKTFAMSEGLLPMDERMTRFSQRIDLERGLVIGALTMALGIGLLVAVVYQWVTRDFGRLDYAYTMRWAIPGFTLTSLGVQTVFASFFLGILGLKRR